MKKALVLAILSVIFVAAVFQMDTYSDARGKPATPAEVLKFANEDYLDLYGVKDYFKEETSKGSYRKDLLQKGLLQVPNVTMKSSTGPVMAPNWTEGSMNIPAIPGKEILYRQRMFPGSPGGAARRFRISP